MSTFSSSPRPSTAEASHGTPHSQKDFNITKEEFEKLKADHDAALQRIVRLERELEDYEIDLPPRPGEEDSEVDEDEGGKEGGNNAASPELEIIADEAPPQSETPVKKRRDWLVKYFLKWKGEKLIGSAKLQPWVFMVFSFIGSFIGIGVVGLMSQYWMMPWYHIPGIIPSFGASAVLVFGTESPLAQPRAVLGGHLIAALIGTVLYTLMRSTGLTWLIGALSVALSIVAMQLTKTIHPPAGATALIAVIGPPEVHAEGFLYLAFPTLSGALIMVLVGLLVMNVKYRYPKFWW